MKRLPGTALLRAGRGLALPILLLLGAAIALENIEATPLASLRNAQFDRYQRQMPRPRDNEPVIVVGIDSQSLAAHGQWPWSRELLAELTKKILAGQPLALGIDIVFAEPDRYSPGVLGEKLAGLPRNILAKLPEPDSVLAEALGTGPTVLAVVGLANPLPGSRPPHKPLPLLAGGDLARQPIARFPSAVVSRPVLEKAARGEGFINASPDALRSSSERGVLRRVPTLAFIDHQPFLPLSLEMLRLALGSEGQTVPEFDRHGMTSLRVGDYRLPTQGNGDLLIHYGKASSHYYLSAADVLAGVHAPEIFQSRFVILGFNSTGLQDSIVTPLGEIVPGVDIHVQVIESMLTGAALQRPYWLPRVELAALLLGGLLLIVAVPALRPRLAVLSYSGLAGLLIGGGYLAFYSGQWLFDGPSLSLLLSPVFVSLLGNTLIEADAKRRQAERELQDSREAAARTAGELDAARRIQMGLLPDPQALFADEQRFAVAALLEPALAVGGDYYDCFMLDEDRLCVAIGDVSGKGIPASLFMAISKTLTGTLTRLETDLGQAIRDVERELNRENPEYLFVTAFVAVLDAASGQLNFVCAGHDAPLLVRRGAISKVATQTHGGPPFCATDSYPYRADQMQLEPGDLLCLFTDGVTEASDGQSLFGGERLAAALLRHREKAPPDLLAALRDEVRAFEAGHPAADDLTLLLLNYCGQPAPTAKNGAL